MKPKLVRFILVVVGLVLATLAGLCFLVSIVAVFDPVGTQMADDHNPFGPPPPRYYSLTLTALSVGMFLFGIRLIKR